MERSKEDYWLGGVIGGISKDQGWNPDVMRLLFALIVGSIPELILLYFVCCIFMPSEK